MRVRFRRLRATGPGASVGRPVSRPFLRFPIGFPMVLMVFLWFEWFSYGLNGFPMVLMVFLWF